MNESVSGRAVIYLRVSTARQASAGGEKEGYSIPAQRDACRRKAEELGASVVDEYADAGASARSADRPALQELLKRLRENRDVDYVIVHKVDRLARDRADDVAIGLTIHKAGAVLVSASEQIDDSPAGTLLHGIMATIAEFYSKNLSHETKKGLHEKARRGGTPGYAPLGYLNSTKRIDGRETKVVVPDPERAPHIQWAFEVYSSGEWSITDLVEELARRGMRTRPTATRAAVPLSRSQVHRILCSSYYTGKLSFGGVEYDGRHPALVDQATWQRVQDVLSGRRISGDRSWRHDHYLKGTLFCVRCDSRLGLTYAKGRGGTYAYFYCLGRNKKRTDCDLPYLSAEAMDEHVMREWKLRRLAPELVELVRASVTEEMREKRATDSELLKSQRRRLIRLDRQRQRLIDAYLAEAIPVSDLRQRQEALAVEQQEAARLIELASVNHALLEQRLEIALGLLEHCDRLYIGSDDKTRRAMNQTFFAALYVDGNGVQQTVLNQPFAELTDRSIGLAEDSDDGDELAGGPENAGGASGGRRTSRSQSSRQDSRGSRRPTGARNKENPAATKGPRGSNVNILAAGVGFEPTEPCHGLGDFQDRPFRPLGHPARGRV
jgi:site-specific DNA recombinase